MNQDDFDRLLRWLDPDRDKAGESYLEICRQLIKFFRSLGRPVAEAEEMTDETIKRVTRKVPQIAATYDGLPVRYCIGVARKVHLERLRPPPPARPSPLPDPWDEKEPRYACLDDCMKKLKPEDQRIALLYYSGNGRAKIEQRRKLADELGGSNALRIRMFRIREALRNCINQCLTPSAH